MECLRAELGHHAPTSAPQHLRLHASFKSREPETLDDSLFWKRATSPTSETETDDLSRSSLSSFERSSSVETLEHEQHELESVREAVHLSKARALALQKELLAAFSAPSFQKCFSELVRGKKRVQYEQLVSQQQLELIGKYGFEVSSAGLLDMQQALKKFSDDPDILVNDLAIEEVLAIDRTHISQSNEEQIHAKHNPKPVTSVSVCDLLRSQLVSFGYAPFQSSIQQLKDTVDSRLGHPDPQGPVQKEILPSFGFEGSKEMIMHCARFLRHREVALLLDAVNAKLGMTPAACRRFRELASSLADSPVHCVRCLQESGADGRRHSVVFRPRNANIPFQLLWYAAVTLKRFEGQGPGRCIRVGSVFPAQNAWAVHKLVHSQENATYKENFKSLEKLVLVMAEDDTMVHPKESEHFGYFKDGSRETLVDMRDAPWYTDDWFGLKSLDQETGGAGLVGTISALLCSALLLVAARQDKKIDFFSTPGNHLRFKTDFLVTMVTKYFVTSSDTSILV
eukprot:s972_g19.t1